MTGWAAIAVLAALAFAVSFLGTRLLRGYALRRSLLDRPNDRSSHQTPTPRGGGLAIVLSFLAAVVALAAVGAVPWPSAAGIGGAGFIVALVGFWDDHGHIAARWRLLAHFAAVIWLLGWLGGPPVPPWLGDSALVQAMVTTAAAIAMVWLINLYNFMDGIDGIASVEAVTVAGGGALAALVAGSEGQAVMPLILIAAVAGFLVWNWPPARIFMGDVGSGFLGVVLAGLALAAGRANDNLLYAWAILLAVFVVDASVTLMRRALRRERVYEAHRSHAYQRASRHHGRHGPVTIAVALINLVWLMPIALVVAADGMPVPAALALAYAPLLLLALYWKAGTPDLPAKSC